MGNFEANNTASQSYIAEQQLAIATRLWRAVTTMDHIDEVFEWLTTQIIQRFHIQAAEIWAFQADPVEQYALQLRTLTIADASLPQHVVANQHIAEFAVHTCKEQRSYSLQPVSQLFSGYPASTLTRYGLNYITSSYFHGPVTLLPPARNAPPSVLKAAPFTLALLLFQHERKPGDLLPSLQFILPQVVLSAKNHGLLPDAQIATPRQPAPLARQVTPIPVPQQQSQLNIWQIIPRRREADLLMSSNPLARSADIPDKQARRLFSAIDGKKNVAELSRVTRMDAQEVQNALQYLIAQRRIDLHEPGGKLINPSLFIA